MCLKSKRSDTFILSANFVWTFQNSCGIVCLATGDITTNLRACQGRKDITNESMALLPTVAG